MWEDPKDLASDTYKERSWSNGAIQTNLSLEIHACSSKQGESANTKKVQEIEIETNQITLRFIKLKDPEMHVSNKKPILEQAVQVIMFQWLFN